MGLIFGRGGVLCLLAFSLSVINMHKQLDLEGLLSLVCCKFNFVNTEE